MNHWLQQATASAKPSARPNSPGKHTRKASSTGKALTRVRELVKRQPVGVWFSSADVFDNTICSVNYACELLKGMAERGELEVCFTLHNSRNKWMFKRISQ